MFQHKLCVAVPGINQIHHFARSGNSLGKFLQCPCRFATSYGSLHEIDCAGTQFVHVDCFR